ncbi:MAG: BatD family protein [Spongiibacteraceae bacterium]
MHPINRYPYQLDQLGKSIFLCLLLALSQLAHAVDTSVRASVDRQTVGIDETFTLSLLADSSRFTSEPDTRELEKSFHIINRQESSRTNITNGKINSSRQWDYTLSAKQVGSVIIPAIVMGDKKTRPISMNITAAAAPTSTRNGNVYLESDVTPRQAYVQSELLYTVKVFTAVNFLDASLDPPKIDNAIVEPRGEQRYRSRIGERNYQVIERNYAIFPQVSGRLTIPALTLQARVESYRPSLLDPGKLVIKRSTEHQLTIHEPDPAFQGPLWLPARELSLSESWSKDKNAVKVGDSITRTISIKADGLLGSQLPALPQNTISNTKLYPDQAKISNGDAQNDWHSVRSESVAIIPTKPGTLSLPEIRVPWWNTKTQRQEVAVLAATEITIVAAELTAQNTSTDTSQTNPAPARAANGNTITTSTKTPWLYLLIAILATSNLVFFGAWRRGKNSSASHEAPKAPAGNAETMAYKTLRELCVKQGDIPALRQALLEWAALRCKKPMSLSDIGVVFPELKTDCDKLNASLFSDAAIEFDYAGLLAKLEACHNAASQTEKAPELAPLYPQ